MPRPNADASRSFRLSSCSTISASRSSSSATDNRPQHRHGPIYPRAAPPDLEAAAVGAVSGPANPRRRAALTLAATSSWVLWAWSTTTQPQPASVPVTAAVKGSSYAPLETSQSQAGSHPSAVKQGKRRAGSGVRVSPSFTPSSLLTRPAMTPLPSAPATALRAPSAGPRRSLAPKKRPSLSSRGDAAFIGIPQLAAAEARRTFRWLPRRSSSAWTENTASSGTPSTGGEGVYDDGSLASPGSGSGSGLGLATARGGGGSGSSSSRLIEQRFSSSSSSSSSSKAHLATAAIPGESSNASVKGSAETKGRQAERHHHLHHHEDRIHELMRYPLVPSAIRAPRYPIVLCHGLYGFDVRGPFLGFEIHYWADALEALRNKVGAEVIVRGVPGTGSIVDRARALHEFLKSPESGVRGRKVNFVGHSMGGLDARYLITNIRPTPDEYTPVSLTTISTPHRGSPFMDWCNANIGVGNEAIEAAVREARAKRLKKEHEKEEEEFNTPRVPYSLKSPIFVRPKNGNGNGSGNGSDTAATADKEVDKAKQAADKTGTKSSSPEGDALNKTIKDSAKDAMLGAAATAAKAVAPDSAASDKQASTKSSKPLVNFSFFTKALSSFGGSFSSYMLSVLDQPAYAQLSTKYMAEVFNPSTPDRDDVKYFSVAARTRKLAVWHPLWLPKLILDAAAESRSAGGEKDGSGDALGGELQGNDGLVSVQSAKWGQFLGVIDGCDHWDLRGEGAPRWSGSSAAKINPATGKPYPAGHPKLRGGKSGEREDREKMERQKAKDDKVAAAAAAKAEGNKSGKSWIDINRLLDVFGAGSGKGSGEKGKKAADVAVASSPSTAATSASSQTSGASNGQSILASSSLSSSEAGTGSVQAPSSKPGGVGQASAHTLADPKPDTSASGSERESSGATVVTTATDKSVMDEASLKKEPSPRSQLERTLPEEQGKEKSLKERAMQHLHHYATAMGPDGAEADRLELPWAVQAKEAKENPAVERPRSAIVSSTSGSLMDETKSRTYDKASAPTTSSTSASTPTSTPPSEEAGVVEDVVEWISARLPRRDEKRREEAERIADELDEVNKAEEREGGRDEVGLGSGTTTTTTTMDGGKDSTATVVATGIAEEEKGKEEEEVSKRVETPSISTSAPTPTPSLTPSRASPSTNSPATPSAPTTAARVQVKLRREAEWQESLGQHSAARELRRELQWHREEMVRGLERERREWEEARRRAAVTKAGWDGEKGGEVGRKERENSIVTAGAGAGAGAGTREDAISSASSNLSSSSDSDSDSSSTSASATEPPDTLSVPDHRIATLATLPNLRSPSYPGGPTLEWDAHAKTKRRGSVPPPIVLSELRERERERERAMASAGGKTDGEGGGEGSQGDIPSTSTSTRTSTSSADPSPSTSTSTSTSAKPNGKDNDKGKPKQQQQRSREERKSRDQDEFERFWVAVCRNLYLEGF